MQPFYIAIYSNPHNIKFTHNMYGGGRGKLIAWEGVLYCTKKVKNRLHCRISEPLCSKYDVR